MPKRTASTIGLLAVMCVGIYYAYDAARLFLYRVAFAGSYTYNLLFTSAGWLIPVAVCVGIFAGASSQHQPVEIKEGKILRHDGVAFLIHWAHALSTLLLLATGVYLGFLFIPRFASTAMMSGFALNAHYVGVLIFLFSVTYHLTDLYLTGSLGDHLPQTSDFKDAIAHYAAKFGIGHRPQEGKYLASERLSYPLWIASVGIIIVTGLIKASAHIWSLPGALLGATTLLHDVGALLVLANLTVHIVLSSIVPWSWPLLKSMLTGYISEEYVSKYHAKWYSELAGTMVGDETGKQIGRGVPS